MLRTALIQLTAAGVLAACPAWALNANPPQSDQNGMQQSGEPSTQARQESLRGQLTENLKQAGFTDVSVRSGLFPGSRQGQKWQSGRHVLQSHLDDRDHRRQGAVDQAQGGKFTDLPSHDELSTKAVGANVYNSAKQEIGSIKDVAIENNRVKAYIVKVDVGNGERFVAVKPSALKLTYDISDKSWRGELDASKQELQSAPEFKYSAAM